MYGKCYILIKFIILSKSGTVAIHAMKGGCLLVLVGIGLSYRLVQYYSDNSKPTFVVNKTVFINLFCNANVIPCR